MNCSNCGKQINSTAKFCKYCGTKVVKIDNPDASRLQTLEVLNSTTKSSKLKIIAIVAIVVIASVVTVGYFMNKDWADTGDNRDPAQVVEQMKADATKKVNSAIITSVEHSYTLKDGTIVYLDYPQVRGIGDDDLQNRINQYINQCENEIDDVVSAYSEHLNSFYYGYDAYPGRIDAWWSIGKNENGILSLDLTYTADVFDYDVYEYVGTMISADINVDLYRNEIITPEVLFADMKAVTQFCWDYLDTYYWYDRTSTINLNDFDSYGISIMEDYVFIEFDQPQLPVYGEYIGIMVPDQFIKPEWQSRI